ncbi:MAG: DNA-binding protein [Oscillospiraceae bacterium]
MAKTEPGSKDLLNPAETIALFELSSRKFYALIRSNVKLDFIAFYGGRRLVIRVLFEKYLDEHAEIRRSRTWQHREK